jgi:hypothetical protein
MRAYEETVFVVVELSIFSIKWKIRSLQILFIYILVKPIKKHVRNIGTVVWILDELWLTRKCYIK